MVRNEEDSGHGTVLLQSVIRAQVRLVLSSPQRVRRGEAYHLMRSEDQVWDPGRDPLPPFPRPDMFVWGGVLTLRVSFPFPAAAPSKNHRCVTQEARRYEKSR